LLPSFMFDFLVHRQIQFMSSQSKQQEIRILPDKPGGLRVKLLRVLQAYVHHDECLVGEMVYVCPFVKTLTDSDEILYE